MAIELVEPVKRVEHYLYALCVMDFNNIPIPRSRLEFFAHALITGVLPEFQAETREEVYITAIITGDYANLPLPKSRADQLLYKICLGETEIRDIELETRYEMLLAYIAEHGDMPLETVLVECINALQTIPNTVEAPVKSAILKGNTLVNLATNGNRFLTLSSSSQTFTLNLSYNLEKNKQYLIVGETTQNGATVQGVCLMMKRKTMGNKYIAKLQMGVGIFSYIITPDDEITGLSFYIHTDDRDNGKTLTVGKAMVIEYQEGMENWDISYFEGMQSVRMPVLTTTGRNVLNPKRFVSTINTSSNDGVVININNQIEDLNFRSLYDELTLPVDTYTITCEVVNGTYLGGNLCIYDENNKNIREFAFKNGSGSTTITSSINKLRLWNAYGTDNCQIRVAITKDGSTTYEPYKTNILTCNEDIELRRIDDVKDELDLLTDELTQRIEEIVLDGFGYYNIGANTNDNYLEFIHPANSKRASIICDKVFTPTQSHQDNTEYIRATEIGIVGYILKSRLSTSDIEGLKAWLSSNNVTVQYQLATESVKTVDLTIQDQDGNAMPYLSTFNDATHVSINAVDIIPQVDLEVRVDANTMANVASQQENVAVAQASLSDAIDAQNDDIEMTQNALDEVKGE